MCLYMNRALTERVKRRKNWITCYKILSVRDKSIYTLYQAKILALHDNVLCVDSPIRDPQTYIKDPRAGMVASNNIVEDGIHAYRRSNVTFPFFGTLCVKCYGHVDDLIAVGERSDIAFTKLYIDPKDFQRLLDIKHGKGKYYYEYE